MALAVARGLSNRQVAEQLFLSVKTVEFHLSHVYDKLGIQRRSQLVLLSTRQDGVPARLRIGAVPGETTHVSAVAAALSGRM